MRNTAELQAQIEKARKQTETGYEIALETVKRLKSTMNELELRISRKENIQDASDSRALSLAIASLSKATDSQILMGRKAWHEYRKLEGYCKQSAVQPAQLETLSVLCRKMEELAADLLCYSPGRFEPGK